MAIGAPSKVITMPVSLEAKPVPVIVTELSAAPLARLVEIFGVTLKVVVGDPEVDPVAVMVRAPEAEAGITKLALQLPLVSAVAETAAAPS